MHNLKIRAWYSSGNMKVAASSNGVVVHHALLLELVVAPSLEVVGLSALVGVGNRLWPGK